MSKTTLTSKIVKTYSTEQRLDTAITKLGLAEVRHMAVRAEDGRWTAIFSAHSDLGLSPAHVGFMVFN